MSRLSLKKSPLYFVLSVVSRSYRILATDYDGFAIEYTCQEGNHGHKDGKEDS